MDDKDMKYAMRFAVEEVVYGMDGNQHTAHRVNFVNLQESNCGFGDTQKLAYEDLLSQESL